MTVKVEEKTKKSGSTYIDIRHVSQGTLALVGDRVVGGRRRKLIEIEGWGRLGRA
jgi:hypothetical protein